jgi:hypothetical protein
MKHEHKSASPCELACPHLSDHPTRQAKQHSNSTHGRTVVCSDHHTGAPFLTSQGELRTRFPQTSAHIGVCPSSGTATFDHLKAPVILQPVDFTLFLSLAAARPAHKLTRKWHVNWHVRIFKNPSKTRKLARKTHSFFSDLNVDSRSACSAYPYKKFYNRAAIGKHSAFPNVGGLSQHFCNLQAIDVAGLSRFLQITQNFSNAEVGPETASEIVVSFAEIALRFAETSQQTLRQISLLPTSYINFADKNTETLKLLRQLRLSTSVL